ncbi:hypothetical protein B0H14DRAFT_2585112 [Mycena olivaceomarginata]|nr:hypothetical protein B0H14DRAFT_2585112 [Mycena olivaceomarginata]
MSTGSGSSSHSRFGSSSSTSSINSLSDTRHSSLYSEYRSNSYPSPSLHMERPNSNIDLQTSLDFEMPDIRAEISHTHQQSNYLDQLQQLQHQNRQLQDQNLILHAQYSTLQQIYNSLLDKISTPSPQSSSSALSASTSSSGLSVAADIPEIVTYKQSEKPGGMLWLLMWVVTSRLCFASGFVASAHVDLHVQSDLS